MAEALPSRVLHKCMETHTQTKFELYSLTEKWKSCVQARFHFWFAPGGGVRGKKFENLYLFYKHPA